MKIVMNWIRVFGINMLVLLVLLLLIEASLRAIWTIRTCLIEACDVSRLTSLQVRMLEHDGEKSKIGLSQRDAVLGYLPTPGFSAVISQDGWNNALVTINSNGLRSNDNGVEINTILTVGDSFTFGDQVSNRFTWPACLERKLGLGVGNGGVFGYGAAQAVKRATIETTNKNYNTVLWSVLLSDDFKRDRLSYRSGFPRPAVVKTSIDTVEWASVPEQDAPGSKFGNHAPSLLAEFIKPFYVNSLLAAVLLDKWLSSGGLPPNFSGKNLNLFHPQAATEQEIIAFSLRQFYEVPVLNKFVVLQYTQFDIGNDNIERLRNTVKTKAKQYNLKVIDTFEALSQALQNHAASKIWNVHHTEFGNQLVCETVAKSMAPPKTLSVQYE